MHRTRVVSGDTAGVPGELLQAGPDGLIVACGSGQIALCELQFEGGKRLNAAAVVAGRRLPPGTRFAKPEA